MSDSFFVSVIIPIHNGSKHIKKCLDSLEDSNYESFEVIVVDDYSDDESSSIAKESNAIVYRLESQSGPAAARNYGASKAKGSLLLFVDSDIRIRKDTIGRIVKDFDDNAELAAVFGSYDSDPYETDNLSQYKNLFHHFVHQNSRSKGLTFWAGCGAIKKDVFNKVGGFNSKKYKKSSIEDIELGYGLRKKGYEIYLDKDLQVKHLKRWDFINWLRVEIFNRAIPWSKLILDSGPIPKDLNLRISDRLSALIVWSLLASIILLISDILIIDISYLGLNKFLLLILALFLTYIFLNKKFYYFLMKKRGLKFTIYITPFHLFYYLYSSFCFVIVYIRYKILRNKFNK